MFLVLLLWKLKEVALIGRLLDRHTLPSIHNCLLKLAVIRLLPHQFPNELLVALLQQVLFLVLDLLFEDADELEHQLVALVAEEHSQVLGLLDLVDVFEGFLTLLLGSPLEVLSDLLGFLGDLFSLALVAHFLQNPLILIVGVQDLDHVVINELLKVLDQIQASELESLLLFSDHPCFNLLALLRLAP